jgi:hypothetical protein
VLKYFPRILHGRRKNEEYAVRNILGWKGLVPLMFKILENRIQGIYMDINRTISNKKLLSVYMETTLNGDFNPKSVIISIHINMKKKKKFNLTNYIIRDGLSQKTISRYCPFKQI